MINQAYRMITSTDTVFSILYGQIFRWGNYSSGLIGGSKSNPTMFVHYHFGIRLAQLPKYNLSKAIKIVISSKINYCQKVLAIWYNIQFSNIQCILRL